MSKKIILGLVLSVLFGFTGLVAHQSRVLASTAYPCSVGGLGLPAGCVGYYRGVAEPVSTCSNLPISASRPCIPSAGDLLSGGMNVNNIGSFITAVEHDLTSGNLQDSDGAALIINAMMGTPTGPNANGVNLAYAQVNAWVTRVEFFNGTNSGYTIDWAYSETCNNETGHPNSSYFTDNDDDAFHTFICGPYNDAGLDDGPAILFEWPGGHFFSIGVSCGNIQGYLDVLPSSVTKPPSPTGKITVTCNLNTAQFTAAVTFGDSNGYATTGSISTTGPGGSYSTAVTSGNSYPIPVKDTSPTKSQTVTLTVTDQGANTTYTAQTPVSPPCQLPPKPTGKITVTCNLNTAQFTAAVTFGDSNGYATTGSISTTGPGGSYSTAVTTGNSYPIPTKDTSPTKSQTVTLTVTDQGKNTTYTAQTPVSPPCQLPPKPTGKIIVTCDQSASQFDAAVTFGDSNGYSTTGKISTGSWAGETVTSGNKNPYPIPQSATNPYNPQTVTLTVTDQGANTTYTAQTPTPCVNLSCGNLSITPSPVDQYTQFNATVTVTNDVGITPPGAIIKIGIAPSGGTSSGSQPDSGSGSTSTATFKNLGPTGGAPGLVNVTWTLTAQGGLTITCKQSFQVANQPYLQVYGGDAMIGASPTFSSAKGTSSCAPDNSGGIYGWNNNSPNYSGAGTEYAVEALGQINGFASAQNSTSSPPIGLSFANSNNGSDTNLGANLFGGLFGASTNDCDFSSDLAGVASQNGNTVNPPNNVNGVLTIYATGNVYISHNILYCIPADTTAKNTCPTEKWASASAIPYFKLVVVGGNIYIDHSVTELDGLYIAEPETGSGGVTTGGTIYTCATNTPLDYSPLTISSYYTTCNSQLNIFGSFIAQQVQFLRTFGSVGNSSGDNLKSSNSAEVFDYTPEMWLPRTNIVTNNGYSAITSLPPVL